jgi:hypothetical protein
VALQLCRQQLASLNLTGRGLQARVFSRGHGYLPVDLPNLHGFCPCDVPAASLCTGQHPVETCWELGSPVWAVRLHGSFSGNSSNFIVIFSGKSRFLALQRKKFPGRSIFHSNPGQSTVKPRANVGLPKFARGSTPYVSEDPTGLPRDFEKCLKTPAHRPPHKHPRWQSRRFGIHSCDTGGSRWSALFEAADVCCSARAAACDSCRKQPPASPHQAKQQCGHVSSRQDLLGSPSSAGAW